MSDFGFTELRHHWAESAEKERAERKEWAHPAMRKIHKYYTDLRNAGWQDAIYCPKDGSFFLAWSPGNILPYRCRYEGEWPDGRWWAYLDGDVWPDRPVLFKLAPPEDKR